MPETERSNIPAAVTRPHLDSEPRATNHTKNGSTKSMRAGTNGYDTHRATPKNPIAANPTAIQATRPSRRIPRHTVSATSGINASPTTSTQSGAASPMTNDMHQYANFTGTSSTRDPLRV